MKQLLFLVLLISGGGLASLYHPFWGLLVYYLLAILRPQYFWDWALPDNVRWSLITAAVVLGSVAMHLPRLALRSRITPVAVLMLGFGLLLAASCLTAYDPGLATKWGTEYFKIILVAVVASLVIDRVWHVQLTAAMVLGTIGYIAFEINSLYVFNNRLDVFHHGLGGLDNNGAGLMLAMGLPLAYAFGVGAPRRWQRMLAWCLGALTLHAVLMTYSRGAMLAAGVGAVYLLLRHRPRQHAVAIGLTLCLLVTVLAGQEIRERFLSTARYQEDNSARSRFDSWEAAWVIAWDHPLTGKGIRNSQLFSENYGADRANRTIHSQYLQIAADSGIPAAVVFIAILVVSWILLNQAWSRCRLHQQHRAREPDTHRTEAMARADEDVAVCMPLALGCQGSLIIYAVGGLFLSLEFFELIWVFIVLASALPATLASRLDEAFQEGHADPEPTSRKPVNLGRRAKSATRWRLRRRTRAVTP